MAYRPDLNDYHYGVYPLIRSGGMPTPGGPGDDHHFFGVVEEIPDEIRVSGRTEEEVLGKLKTEVEKVIENAQTRGELYPFPKLDGYQRLSLWRVQPPDGPPSFLLGTVHFPDPRVCDFPSRIYEALESVDEVWTEADMNPEAVRAVLEKLKMPEGETSEKMLGNKTCMILRGLCSYHEWDYSELVRLQPIAVFMRLVYAMAESSAENQMDMKICRIGESRGKRIGYLESLEEQRESLATKPDEAIADQVAHSAQELALLVSEQGQEFIEPVFYMFLKGADDGFLEPLKSSLGGVFSPLAYYERNSNMVRRILQAIRSADKPSILFSFGMMHAIGPCSVPDLLDIAGLQVERVENE